MTEFRCACSLIVVGILLFSAMSCGTPPADVVLSRAALTADPVVAARILGFERVQDWSIVSGTGTLSSTTVRTEGSAALAAHVRGYVSIRSIPMSSLGHIATTVSYDLFLPAQQPNPYWFGATQLYLNCPSRGVYNAFIGQKELTGLPTGKYSQMQFTVSSSILSQLNGSSYSDLTIAVVLNVPSNATGVYRLDNFRIVPCTPDQGISADGTCQEAMPTGRVVPAASVMNQGPEFTSVAAAINYISSRLQSDPTLGEIRRIKYSAGQPISISIASRDTEPVFVPHDDGTLEVFESRFALLLGGRAGIIRLTGGQPVCLKSAGCNGVCLLGQVLSEDGSCQCSGGQQQQEDGTCTCTQGMTLFNGQCICPEGAFVDESGECVPLSEALSFLPPVAGGCDREFCNIQASYFRETVPFVAQWFFILRLYVAWGTDWFQNGGGYQESSVFCWKAGFIPWACTQKVGTNDMDLTTVFRSGDARTPTHLVTGRDVTRRKLEFTHFFGALALDDAGGIAEGTGADCNSSVCDVDGLCAASTAIGNSTSRTGLPNRLNILSTGINCSQLIIN